MPEVIVLSTQRSGTHLLESFLKNHPDINGRGEMFLRYIRHNITEPNVTSKINVAILMYNQFDVFEALGGKFTNHKIIHLLRNPHDIAISRCQMIADRKEQGESFRAHLLGQQEPQSTVRPMPDMAYYDHYKDYAVEQQRNFTSLLKNVPHLSISYEDFVSGDNSIEYLDERVVEQLSRYLNIDAQFLRMKTPYVRTKNLVSQV